MVFVSALVAALTMVVMVVRTTSAGVKHVILVPAAVTAMAAAATAASTAGAAAAITATAAAVQRRQRRRRRLQLMFNKRALGRLRWRRAPSPASRRQWSWCTTAAGTSRRHAQRRPRPARNKNGANKWEHGAKEAGVKIRIG
eukprot:6180638-Pleurochrysis_carterae.AAC.1